MKPKPDFIKASSCLALLLMFYFLFPSGTSNNTTDHNCSVEIPFRVSLAGFFISGHVCGEEKVKDMPQVNFRVKADDRLKSAF